MNDPILIVSLVSVAASVAALARSLWHSWKLEWHSSQNDGRG